MSDDRWARIDRLYHAALEHPADDRASFVRREAHGDADLAAEVEALLAYDGQPAAFMECSAMELAARALAAQPDASEPAGRPATIGSYEILGALGAGGMGEVYLARDRRLARNVALKLLRPDLVHPDWIARFRHEALAASALNHPNIVTIYEIGEHDGMSFIAAEHADGVTLREHLKKGPVPAPELVGIALQIADGLAAAHEAGVVHRDIKPDNLVLRADGLVKILDFGIATRTGSGAAPAPDGSAGLEGAVIGTMGYMSPEQRQGVRVDAGTDLWSLGIVIYEMATGHLPTSAAEADPGHLMPELARIVRRALSPARGDRYATAREMAGDLRVLRTALDGPSGTGAESGGRDGDGRSRGSRMRLGAAALVVVAATAYLVVVAGRARQGSTIDSIGIMPFHHAAGMRDGAYLADALTTSLGRELSQLSSVRQAAASEAARYGRLGVPPAQAGREMRVGAVLTGTLDRRAETVIVRLELLRSAEGGALWKQRYVRPLDDVLTLRTEIARDLVEAIGIPPRSLPAASDATRDPAAYQLYAKGRYHVQRRTPDDLRKGLEYLREAVAMDPGYGRAHAELAEAYILLAMTSDVPPKEVFPHARTAADHALAIDPELSEARVSMGIIKFWFDWDWNGAEAEFRRATAAAQPDPAAHVFYGHLLSNLGDHTGALQQMRRALDYEPHSPLTNALFAQCLYYQGRYDESLAHLRKTLDLDPTFWLTHNMMGRIYGRMGMPGEALQAFDRATELGGSLIVTASAGYTLAVSGRRDEARAVLERLKRHSAQAYVPSSNFALVHLGLGEREKALDRLEEAVAARDLLVTFLAVEPRWADLAGDPRFTALLETIGLKR